MYHVDWVCFHNRSGYAQAAQDYIYALRNSGQYNLHVTILHASPDQVSLTPGRYTELLAMMNNPLPDDRFVQIFHCVPGMQRRVKRNAPGIGFATFETVGPPEEWVATLNMNDAVICPSKFNMQIFKDAGLTTPIHHIPHVLDTTLFNPSSPSEDRHPEFTFLFFAAWKQRKGWKELIEAWFREFSKSDGVRLVIKTDRLSRSMLEIGNIRKNMGLSEEEVAPISYETRILNEVELPRFFKKADCLICPTYGEGFGLPCLQAMAVGVPVIVTDYSGCTEYATDDTATLLKPSGFILYNEMDGIPQFRNKKWAHVSVEAIRHSMRHVLNNTDIVKKKADNASALVAQEFNYARAVEGFNRLMESIE